jgi:pilus assembly protein CpaF
MALMAGIDIPLAAVREQIRQGIDLVVHQERGADGRRRIVEIGEMDRASEGYALRTLAP